MRKNLVYALIFCSILILGLGIAVSNVQAQDNPPAPSGDVVLFGGKPDAPLVEEIGDVIFFKVLNVDDLIMRGPYASERISFGLPANWKLVDGAQIQLDIFTDYSGVGSVTVDSMAGHGLGGALEVSFNGDLVDIILLSEVGDRTVSVSIPVESLESTRRDGLMEVSLFLDAALDCEFDQQTLLVVHDTSHLILPHESRPPDTDLTKLPRPIFQDTFVQEAAVILIPDQPTTGELQAALAVSAGFGRMTGGDLRLSFMRASQLTDQVWGANHLIFVGLPSAFPMLGSVALPAPASGSIYNAAGASPDDGIVQMAVSPWNGDKVVLVVGGNSEAGVIKAGQAVSTGIIRVGAQPNLSLVESVQPYEYASFTGMDRTLADLGYEGDTSDYLGFSTFEYLFYIPPGHAVGVGAYFNLAFAHSTLLEYTRSGMVVNLNGQPIGSVRLSDDSANGFDTRIAIPANLVRAGTNKITVDINLVPITVCLDPRLANLWLRVDSTSFFHLPLNPVVDPSSPVLNLNQYSEPFSLDPLLNTTAFVLAPGDPNGWLVALQIAADLGNQSGISLANLIAVFDGAIPDEVRQMRDLIIVGLPSTLPILTELADVLPASFEAGSDLAIERNLQVSYRLLPGVSVGYLELLSAPWNNQRAVLAILGSTNQGVQWSGNALTTPRLSGRLTGDFAAINNEQVVTTDTRDYSAQSALALTVPDGVVQLTTETGDATYNR
ncbi:MAG: cellulose biosynthesis cyclic di-GMP-binding regulatory protein BcsB, partial [Chloroflexi bacterium]|nr:cellulose biosynthesis cyclic di-GMP-binding regulatory protein BcsB [Chloroflexota bacterium]